MYYCENCNYPIDSEVLGTGTDTTAYCPNCKDWVNVYEEEDE